jgi:hypothetical protein
MSLSWMLSFWKRHTNYTDKIHTKHNFCHYFHEAPWSSSIVNQGPKTGPHRIRHTRPSSKNLQHIYAHATYKCNNKLYICKQAQHNVEKNYERDEWTSIASAKGNGKVKPRETTRLNTWTESTISKWTHRSLTKDTYNLVLFFFPRWWNTHPTSDIETLTLTTLVSIYSVGRVFHFQNNLWFQLFEKFRIKELRGLVIWGKKIRIKDPPVLSIWRKNQNQRTSSSSYFKNLKKEPAIF